MGQETASFQTNETFHIKKQSAGHKIMMQNQHCMIHKICCTIVTSEVPTYIYCAECVVSILYSKTETIIRVTFLLKNGNILFILYLYIKVILGMKCLIIFLP